MQCGLVADVEADKGQRSLRSTLGAQSGLDLGVRTGVGRRGADAAGSQTCHHARTEETGRTGDENMGRWCAHGW